MKGGAILSILGGKAREYFSIEQKFEWNKQQYLLWLGEEYCVGTMFNVSPEVKGNYIV